MQLLPLQAQAKVYMKILGHYIVLSTRIWAKILGLSGHSRTLGSYVNVIAYCGI